jgi:PelA/Pel-15E family pectate lyase
MKKRFTKQFQWIAMLCIIFLSPATGASDGAGDYLKKPTEWFSSADAKTIAANILSYQAELGGWPKNTDTTHTLYKGKKEELHPTFDNGATTDEMRFLGQCYNATKDPLYQKAFARGLAYILKAQYPNGGWPQYYPLSKQYHRHITFNDGSMVRLLEFTREIYSSPAYAFVPEQDRQQCKKSFSLGIDCILKCQIKSQGNLTVWCAQHDEIDFSPRPARAYELASFSGSESVGVTRMLMSIDAPSPEIIAAVEGAVAWLQSAKLTGIKVVDASDAKSPTGKNKIVVKDPKAPALWARFYDLTTKKPMFVDRDGVPKSTLAEIGYERRNGYSWYGNWATNLLEKEYPKWKNKWVR